MELLNILTAMMLLFAEITHITSIIAAIVLTMKRWIIASNHLARRFFMVLVERLRLPKHISSSPNDQGIPEARQSLQQGLLED